MAPEWAGDHIPELPDAAERRRLPAAARLQTRVTAVDERLLAAARVGHPTIAWWWGKRRTVQGPGAWCYLCDQLIVNFALNWPMPDRAKAAVLVHRDRHMVEHEQAGAS